jgi:hypothetical protein
MSKELYRKVYLTKVCICSLESDASTGDCIIGWLQNADGESFWVLFFFL